jgi:hypothetical protein
MRRLILLPLALLGLASLGLASAGAFPMIHGADASAVGMIVKLSPTSISVGRHEHHRLTCTLVPSSPATALFAAGDRVKIACAAGSLVAIADVPKSRKSDHDGAPGAATTSQPTLTYAIGPITARSDTSLSVQTMTCTVGPGSPSTGGFIVGTVVRMACEDGILVALKRSDDGPRTATTTTTTAATTTTQPLISAITGTVVTLGTSITVNGGDDGRASLTCTITGDSPSTSGFPVGTHVRMYCKNAVLLSLSRVDAPTTTTASTTTTTTAPPVYSGISGTIAALGSTAITVNRTSGDGPLSLACTIGPGSPSTSGFAPGSSVRMYCKDGALVILQHPDAPPAGTTTTTTTTTTTGSGDTGRT